MRRGGIKAFKWTQVTLIVLGLLLILFLVKAIPLFIGKPVVTVDYLAQYNQLSCPKNYNPAENAAFYYQKAYDAFVKMPDELSPLKYWADANDLQKATLKNWLVSNTTAFDYFRKGVDKPYLWVERNPSNRIYAMGGFTIPDLEQYRKLIFAVILQARSFAAEGRYQAAFESLVTCYRSAHHKCQSNLLLFEQYSGLYTQIKVVENGFLITEQYEIDSLALKYFQDALQTEFEKNSFVPGLHAEKLNIYDAVQCAFLDDGKGTGRWAWSNRWHVMPLLTDKSAFQVKCINMGRRLDACFVGPTRNEMAEKIEEIALLTDQAMTKTPWQIQQEGIDYFEQIKTINNSHILFDFLGLDSSGIYRQYYKEKAQTEALIAVLAIRRYKNDTGQLPETLDILVAKDYLRSVPRDPYSGNSLIYKLTDVGFKLYSVGKDFTDNGGCIDKNTSFLPEISLHFESPDVVYWPIEIVEPNVPDLGTIFM